MALFNYLLRRAVRHWQLFLTLSLGVIMSTALLSSSPLLVNTVMEMGLRHEILAADTLDQNLRLQTYTPTEESTIDGLDARVRTVLQARLQDLARQTILSISSHWMIPWEEGEAILDQRITLCFHEGIEDHVEFVAGAWPAAAGVLTDTIPVVVGEEMALAYNLELGDRLGLSYKRTDPQPLKWLQVTGIIRPRDPGEDYWFAEYSPLRGQSDQRWSARYSAFLLDDSFYQSVEALLPGTESQATWNVVLAAEEITIPRIPEVNGRVAALKDELYSGTDIFQVSTGIDDLVVRFANEAEAVRAPLYCLTGEIVLLVLYYVVMVAALSVQQVERELAMLRSRGASGWHILGIQATEAGLLGAVALLSGPGLGMALLRGITLFGPLRDIQPSAWTLQLTWGAWLAAGVGAVACVIGLLLPMVPTLRRSIVTYQQAVTRPPQAPWWQRWYLDVILLLVGLILLWRLHMHGGIVVGDASRPKVDWLLLLSPLTLLLGSAAILLRVLPLILRLFAHLAARGRDLSAALALWQVSRNPARVVLLVLLLTLAMSLGMLSSSLSATLDVSEHERASYAVGGDMRFVSSYPLGLSYIADEPGVHLATSVFRSLGTVDLQSYTAYPRFEVLGIDPPALAAVATFRDDFAEGPMNELLDRIVLDEDPSQGTLTLPGRPVSVGVWVWSQKDRDMPTTRYWFTPYGESDLDRIGLTAKLRTAQGEYLSVALKPPETAGCPHPCCSGTCRGGPHAGQNRSDHGLWRYFYAVLPDLPAASYPLELHSFWIQNLARGDGGYVPDDMELAMDDVTVIDDDTGRVLIAESFEQSTRTWYLDHPRSYSQYATTSLAHSGQARQELSLDFELPRKTIAFKMTGHHLADELPALASPAFLSAAELQVGDTVSVWISSLSNVAIRIVGPIRYFPTMYENQVLEPVPLEAGFLIVSRDPLMIRMNDRSATPSNANEVWLSTGEQISADRLMLAVPAIDRIWQVEAVRTAVKADPMALGLRSVTLYGYLLTSVLSIVGFGTYFYMSARRREATYGILRALGLSPQQLYASLVSEQLILILAGLALGILLGGMLNSLVLPGLPITLGDQPPVPPFRASVDWAAVGRIGLALAGALLLSLSAATLLLWRSRIHRVLRIGEE